MSDNFETETKQLLSKLRALQIQQAYNVTLMKKLEEEVLKISSGLALLDEGFKGLAEGLK